MEIFCFLFFLFVFIYESVQFLRYAHVPCVVINSHGKDVITLIKVKRKYRKQVCLELNKYSDMEID